MSEVLLYHCPVLGAATPFLAPFVSERTHYLGDGKFDEASNWKEKRSKGGARRQPPPPYSNRTVVPRS